MACSLMGTEPSSLSLLALGHHWETNCLYFFLVSGSSRQVSPWEKPSRILSQVLPSMGWGEVGHRLRVTESQRVAQASVER